MGVTEQEIHGSFACCARSSGCYAEFGIIGTACLCANGMVNRVHFLLEGSDPRRSFWVWFHSPCTPQCIGHFRKES